MSKLVDQIVLVCPSCGTVNPAVRTAVMTAPAACVRCNKPFPMLSDAGLSRSEETTLSPATLTRLMAAANNR